MNDYFVFLLIIALIEASEVSHCLYLDKQMIKCLQCEVGYHLNKQDNKCQSQKSNMIMQGSGFQRKSTLKQWNQNQQISLSVNKQNKRSLFDGRFLQPVSIECSYFDPNNMNQCLLCPQNYFPLNQTCQLITKNCISYDKKSGKCLNCRQKYQIFQNKCITKNCNQYSTETQECLKCQTGYKLNEDFQCLPLIIIDKNCKIIGINSQCKQCMNDFYLQTSINKCVSVHSLCRSYSKNGQCTTCYPGYTMILQLGVCQVANFPYCKIQQTALSICAECIEGFFLTTNNICQPINPLCKQNNLTNGKCLTCYKGYQLINGECKVIIPDPYCKKINQNQKTCEQCVDKYYLKGQNCVMVNSLCNNYDKLSGQCTQCYSGYKLAFGNCIISYQILKSTIVQVQCENGYYRNSQGKCSQVKKFCKTYNLTNGECITCLPGYSLFNNTSCEIEKLLSKNQDQNCISFINSTNCQLCNKNYLLLAGKCKKVDQSCKTFNSKNGSCLSCYNLYILVGGKCQFMLSTFQQPSTVTNTLTSQQLTLISGTRDINCIKYKLGTCIECSLGFYLLLNKGCLQLDPLCKSHNLTNGQCLSCYDGYFFNTTNKKCQITKKSRIPYCQAINPLSQLCDSCMLGYYLAPTMTECLYLSILCTKYDMQNGQCYECISGYVLQDGQCMYPALGIDWNCVSYNQGFCKKCKTGYQLLDYRCIEIITTYQK